MARDPVCGMEVSEKTAKYKSEYKDEAYYFCNKYCKIVFEEDPEKYLK
jgi:YHS domain-containing protein